jgi:hypothetical protein
LDKTIDFFNPNSVDPNAVAKATEAADRARLMAYNENLLKLGGDPTKLSAAQDQLLINLSNDAGQRAYDAAFKAATPGVLTRYAPLAGLGIAGLAASGAFSTKRPDVEKPEEFQGPTGYQKYYMNPTIYGLEFGGIRPTSFGDRYAFTGYAEGGGVMGTPQAMRVGGKTYPRKVGSINGPGTGTSDSIPAMLSDGEFVFTAKAVRAMGNGSRRKGAKKMYQLMKMLEGKSA